MFNDNSNELVSNELLEKFNFLDRTLFNVISECVKLQNSLHIENASFLKQIVKDGKADLIFEHSSINAVRAAFGALTVESCAANTSSVEWLAKVWCSESSESIDCWEIGKRISQYRQKLEQTLSWIKPIEDIFLKEGEKK